jgi:alkylation response protein AidB-like acyl-CoA dehydrogenase
MPTPPPNAPALDKFAAEVHAFYAEHAIPAADATAPGGDDTAIFVEIDPDSDRRELAEAKRFRAALFDAGLAAITAPAEYGGRGLDRRYEAILGEISARYVYPTSRFFGIGIGMVAPTILAHGLPQIRERYVRAIYRGDIIACQLFSEPGAGSDLAGVSARAIRDGDRWIVNGQKVWTSVAEHADVGEILVRTDPAAPKHEGLSMFLVDMRAPGVEVRPLRQMTGGASFSEVFLTDVEIPADHLLGEVSRGWQVALTTLGNERATVAAGGEFSQRLRFMQFPRLLDLARRAGRESDPLVRQELARLYTIERIASWTTEDALAAVRSGQAPGPELSMSKLVRTNHMRNVADFVGDVLGPDLVVDSGEPGTYAWTSFVLGVPGMRIAGGSDEVQYKIIGERVLGLPKEPSGEPTVSR